MAATFGGSRRLGLFVCIVASLNDDRTDPHPHDPKIANSDALLSQGRQIFRFDTFGDEAFWGGQLRLNEAIASSLSPRTALHLDNPATTLALLQLNAVVGLTGFFDASGTRLTSIGIQCALCHSTVNDSLPPGIGSRLDGWANHDLNVGVIVALSPNLQPVADVLGVDVSTVRHVLNSWGPGKFDAELFLDGKAFNPQQVSHGVVTGTNISAATMIPNAFGLAGFNQHTWTGAWGTVSYWNALVANLEMHGIGTFFDPRRHSSLLLPETASVICVFRRTMIKSLLNFPHSTSINSPFPRRSLHQVSILM